MVSEKYPEQLVFGLDIGTRSIVGTVGYRTNQQFNIVAQSVREHETRSMIDGQIHDIKKVSETIQEVKTELESQLETTLTEVCIAAAGRVLKTVKVLAEHQFPVETAITEDHIRSLDLMGVEKAYQTLREEMKENRNNFYCVGYSVINYTLNGYTMFKLNGHKAARIGAEILATFLPDEVINGLYAAVEAAGLQVASLTLEPIAAIKVAIPENYRLLNIAMVDVGAGTSDISITKDGSIIAYGMIPNAGDEITEAIAQRYLVDFSVAEKIKTSCLRRKSVSFKNVMGISNKLSTDEVIEAVSEIIHRITKSIAEKITELNGDKSVSAVFVVGGGGKIPGFVSCLADYLNLPPERVALRGEDVLKSVAFLQKKMKKDSLMVTPVGICLNYYDQSNNFIFVTVNQERVKLYDNGKLTISDAAVQLSYSNDQLFPRRGKALHFTLNNAPHAIRGEQGEAACIRLNNETVGITHEIKHNDVIEIMESTSGLDAQSEIRQLPEYKSTIVFQVNGSKLSCPRLVLANGEMVSEYYRIQEKDMLQILDYYTLQQFKKFMDIEYNGEIMVNDAPAKPDQKIFDHDILQFNLSAKNQALIKESVPNNEPPAKAAVIVEPESFDAAVKDTKPEPASDWFILKEQKITPALNPVNKPVNNPATDIYVTVNGMAIKLDNKKEYIYVDILDYYPFDLSSMKGSELITLLNGERVDFTAPIKDSDKIEIFWK